MLQVISAQKLTNRPKDEDWFICTIIGDEDIDQSYITGADVIGMSPDDRIAVGSVILTPSARYIAFEDENFTQKGA